MGAPISLLAVPNVSEGKDASKIDAIGRAFAKGGEAQLLDVHSDPNHHRTVYTLCGQPGSLARALLAGAAEAVRCVDISDGRGEHPHVGAVDIIPLVYPTARARGAAFAEALITADLIATSLELPVLLYGALAEGRSRAELRRGGVSGLSDRIASGEIRPDFGPAGLHPTAGATLVGARAPIVAFNLELGAGASLEDARRIAALIREGGGEGLPGLRAIGVDLGDRAQVSMNVERPAELPLRLVVGAVSRHAPISRAELVGLAPSVAFEGFPQGVRLPGFDPSRHLIENALGL